MSTPLDVVQKDPKQFIRYIEPETETKPVVSIILPSYNAHNTMKRTLSSIAMQQNIDEIETIIVDDCSALPYDHIAQQFSHMMKIKIVKMLKNGGPGAARQVGFDHCSGDYIMWMDADDTLVSSDTVTTLKNVMIQKEMDCVYGRFLEQNEDGSIYPHEVHMVWMFGKMYRRSFLEKWNIRFNTSLSNEDTGFNCVVKGCSDRVWYIPKDVYIWHFKPNSITRIKQGMYGSDSGYKGYLDNMVWQIKELQKRFVNRNYILSEIVNIMCTLYCFHVENMQRYPLNTEISINWIRGYYALVYQPYEEYIDESMLYTSFANVSAGQNLAGKGIIPKITFKDFMEQVTTVPYVVDPDEEICGATPAGFIPEITDPNWPVEITEYYNSVESKLNIDSNTNHSRYGGMKKKLGIPLNEDDYDPMYTGAEDIKEEIKPVVEKLVEFGKDYTYTFDTPTKDTVQDLMNRIETSKDLIDLIPTEIFTNSVIQEDEGFQVTKETPSQEIRSDVLVSKLKEREKNRRNKNKKNNKPTSALWPTYDPSMETTTEEE